MKNKKDTFETVLACILVFCFIIGIIALIILVDFLIEKNTAASKIRDFILIFVLFIICACVCIDYTVSFFREIISLIRRKEFKPVRVRIVKLEHYDDEYSAWQKAMVQFQKVVENYSQNTAFTNSWI